MSTTETLSKKFINRITKFFIRQQWYCVNLLKLKLFKVYYVAFFDFSI